MELSRGFQIEKPRIFVPWDIGEETFQKIFPELHSRLVTAGYFTAHCTSLGGLPHELGFHFHPRGSGRLSELEFFHTSYSDLTTSYKEFQQHLGITFGSPTVTTPGSEGFPSHAWRIPGAEVVHFVLDRFGPEEHVRIKRRTSEQT